MCLSLAHQGEHHGRFAFGFKDLHSPHGTWAEFAAVRAASTGFLPADRFRVVSKGDKLEQAAVHEGGGRKGGGATWAQLGALGIAGLSAWGLGEAL